MQGIGNFTFCENMTCKEIQNEELFVSPYWSPCVVRIVKCTRPTQMVVACEYYDAYTKYTIYLVKITKKIKWKIILENSHLEGRYRMGKLTIRRVLWTENER
jgi:hypothetical protein